MSVIVELGSPDPKKKVVKYTSDSEVLSSAYVGKEALDELGNPDKLKVTIEAA